jgi:hypothetical protein
MQARFGLQMGKNWIVSDILKIDGADRDICQDVPKYIKSLVRSSIERNCKFMITPIQYFLKFSHQPGPGIESFLKLSYQSSPVSNTNFLAGIRQLYYLAVKLV